MDLTADKKNLIDDMSYVEMLKIWRFAPLGDVFITGATGEYLKSRMEQMRALPGGGDLHIKASKEIGW